jgi:DNA modification methylase
MRFSISQAGATSSSTPFLGSGSTLIAAEKTGRRCFGVEIDPIYVDVIVRRYQEVTGKAATLRRG